MLFIPPQIKYDAIHQKMTVVIRTGPRVVPYHRVRQSRLFTEMKAIPKRCSSGDSCLTAQIRWDPGLKKGPRMFRSMKRSDGTLSNVSVFRHDELNNCLPEVIDPVSGAE